MVVIYQAKGIYKKHGLPGNPGPWMHPRSNPQANGFFIGLARNNDVFHRDGSTRNFRLTFFSQDPRTGSLGGFGLSYEDNNGATPVDLLLGNSDAQGA